LRSVLYADHLSAASDQPWMGGNAGEEQGRQLVEERRQGKKSKVRKRDESEREKRRRRRGRKNSTFFDLSIFSLSLPPRGIEPFQKNFAFLSPSSLLLSLSRFTQCASRDHSAAPPTPRRGSPRPRPRRPRAGGRAQRKWRAAASSARRSSMLRCPLPLLLLLLLRLPREQQVGPLRSSPPCAAGSPGSSAGPLEEEQQQ